ncbi:MAG: hypothetical protein K8S56_02305 [Candidatus Cloacimonetes bacterium]|nr:hypothetical protein [Candidatus Cloacimonadota bacterium]
MVITFSTITGLIQKGLWTRDIVTAIIDKSSSFDKATRELMKAYKTAFKVALEIKIEELTFWDEQTEELISGGNVDTLIHILTYFENPDKFHENILQIPNLPEEFKGLTIEDTTRLKNEFEKRIPETESKAVILKYLIDSGKVNCEITKRLKGMDETLGEVKENTEEILRKVSTISDNEIKRNVSTKYLAGGTPTSETVVIGRDHDLKQVWEQLEAEKTLLLLNGLGGIGKTTLARKYLTQYADNYNHIVWLEVSGGIKEAFIGNKVHHSK